MLIEYDDSNEISQEKEEILLEPRKEKKKELPELSLHAMEGSLSHTTIRILGHINNKPVNILLDSGSTHNFIDPKAVHGTGLQIEHTSSFSVTIAGDDKLQTVGVCKDVLVKCQGTDIVADFHILPIGGCQMVLGVEWMHTLDEVSLNFQFQKVRLVKGDKQWVLKGIHLGSMELVHEGVMDKTMCQMAKGWIMYACSKVEEGSSIGTEVMSSEMRALCTEFSKIFEKPKGLPPRRSYDHQILLVKDAEPVNLRPYRHPWEQKNAIEKND